MKNFLICLFFMMLISIMSFAGDPSRKGTTGAEQLLIPVGARSIATGGAFLANVSGLESIYYNPAGLDISRQTEAMFSFMSYLADIKVSYFALGTSLGSLGSVGLSVKTFDFGDIPVTTVDAPDGNGTNYSPSFYTLGLSYSKVITDRVTVGTTFKIVSEKIMQTSATGYAIDLGVQYRFPSNISIGASVKNIGTDMKYTGQDLQVKTVVPDTPPETNEGSYEAVTEAFQIPSYFELSTSYFYNVNETNQISVAAAFRNNNVMEDQMVFGVEYGFLNTFFLRGGYDMLLQNTSSSIYGINFGAGINYRFAEGVGFTLDYAFRDVKDFPQPNHVFTVKLSMK
jgi:opacity protein-like surface antigen